MATFANRQGGESSPGVPLRTVLLSVLMLWAVYFLITTLRGYIAGFEFQQEMLWRRGVVLVVGIAMTLVLWALVRLFDSRPFWMRAIAALLIALPVSIPIAQTNQWVFKELQAKEEERMGREAGINLQRDAAGNLTLKVPVKRVQKFENASDPLAEEDVVSESLVIAPAPTLREQWVEILDQALGRYFLLLAWASLYFSLLSGYQARAAERRAGEFRNAAKAAELRSLRYQVNPHFLFNTLNSLSALVLTSKPERAEQMIQMISNFYRRSLADDPTGEVALEQEFDLQRLYLDIETIRFPERLRCVFDLPPDLAEARVPGMILQPLVENSVKYAVSAVNRPVTITVSAREEAGGLVLTVSDDGPGVPENGGHGFGIGLANVRDRLEARFGDDVVLASGSVPGGHKSEIRIPLARNG